MPYCRVCQRTYPKERKSCPYCGSSSPQIFLGSRQGAGWAPVFTSDSLAEITVIKSLLEFHGYRAVMLSKGRFQRIFVPIFRGNHRSGEPIYRLMVQEEELQSCRQIIEESRRTGKDKLSTNINRFRGKGKDKYDKS